MHPANRFSPAMLSLTLLLGCGADPAEHADAGASGRDAGRAIDASSTDAAFPAEDGGARRDASDGGEPDGGTPVDAGLPPTDAALPPIDAGPPCGTSRPDVSSIRGTEGLAISRDGTLYYSQRGGVGRLVAGGAPEHGWVRIAETSTILGLALDATNERLYVSSPATNTIHVIALDAAIPSASVFLRSAPSNGLAIGPDGALYYSDFGAHRVMRAETSGASPTPTVVTTSPVRQANGVTFMGDGTLLVASYETGDIFRLTLRSGRESARSTFASIEGTPDGFAIDAEGRVYVTDNVGGTVIRLEHDGSAPSVVLRGIMWAGSLEFGAGPLDCEDLYVASSNALGRYEGTTPGARVHWH